MLTYLEEARSRDGEVRASTRWFPACSFLGDTADALVELLERGASGVYHLDGNPGLSLYEIASALARLHGGRWPVVAVDEPAYDNRMVDERISVAPITRRFDPS